MIRHYFPSKGRQRHLFAFSRAYLMNSSPEPDFERAKQFICQTLQQQEALISAENAGHVRHYIRHAEYEMAFEVLFLSLMEHPRPAVTGVDFARAVKMARELRIDGEEGSVFDDDFFSKLSTYEAGA